MPIPERQKVDNNVHLFRHNTTIGQTDGQNWYNNIALCMHYMLTRDKNYSCRRDFLYVVKVEAYSSSIGPVSQVFCIRAIHQSRPTPMEA